MSHLLPICASLKPRLLYCAFCRDIHVLRLHRLEAGMLSCTFLNPWSLWSNDFCGHMYLDLTPINTEMAEIIIAIIWSEDMPSVWWSFLFFICEWRNWSAAVCLPHAVFVLNAYNPFKKQRPCQAFLTWLFILFKRTMQACLFLFCFTFIHIGSQAHTVQGKACFREIRFLEALTVLCIFPSSLFSCEQCFSPS